MMLTSDLLRIKKRKERITPRWIDDSDEESLEKATQLISVFEATPPPTRADVDQSLDVLVGHSTDFLVWRGLAKLLHDRSEFETAGALDPIAVRRFVFEASVGGRALDLDSRQKVLEEAALHFETSAEHLEEHLYADLAHRQHLTSFKKISPEQLLERYNVALAQAVLYRARNMVIVLTKPPPKRLRYFFQMLKFHGLMHSVEREKKTLTITLSGPASLFSMGRKYGLALAKFFPVILTMRLWSVRAELDWERGKVHVFEVSNEQGLKTHYRARGQWISEEEKWFESRFEKKAPDWTLERHGEVLQLDRGNVLVPNYVLTAPDGRKVFAELIGFWRADYLDRRLKWMSSLKEPLVLIVAERLRSGRDPLEEIPAPVVFYKSAIRVERVIEAAEAALSTFPQSPE